MALPFVPPVVWGMETRYPQAPRTEIKFSDLSFRFGLVVKDLRVETHSPFDATLCVLAMAPERDGNEWIELQFREPLGRRYLEAGTSEKRAILKSVFHKMISHEICEGLVADDGSRPFDPHAGATGGSGEP